jgi:hypothetical protein
MMSIKDGNGGDIPLFDVPVVAKAPTNDTSTTQVRQVFDHWVAVHRDGRRGPIPVLSAKRQSKIARAIADHGVEVCIQAVSGCAMSDWHMGDNPRRKRYDDIELILRDAAHVERFATIYLEGDDDAARRDFLAGDT